MTTRPRAQRALTVLFLGIGSAIGWSSPALAGSTSILAAGSDVGGGEVRIFNSVASNTGRLIGSLTPYGANFKGGVRVATGDVTGDSTPDLVCVNGKGAKVEVVIYRGDLTGALVSGFTELNRFNTFDPQHTGGGFIALGNLVTADAALELVVSTDKGTTTKLETYDVASDGAETLLVNIEPFSFQNNGGCKVACGNFNGVAGDEIVIGPGAALEPRIEVILADGSDFADFAAFAADANGGVFVAAGNVDGDAAIEIVCGTGKGVETMVSVWDVPSGGGSDTATEVITFDPFPENFKGGVHVGIGDPLVEGATPASIVVGGAARPSARRSQLGVFRFITGTGITPLGLDGLNVSFSKIPKKAGLFPQV